MATPEFGHVIAPKADLIITGGNYSGCMVANSVYANGEGHLYPYRGGTLIGFHAKIDATKLVNNTTPHDRQKYNFILEKLENTIADTEPDSAFWIRLDNVQNHGSEITFDNVPFFEEGEHYFRIYEESKDYPNTEIDENQFIVYVNVTSRAEDGKIIYEVDEENLKYYRVTNKNDLLSIAHNSEDNNKTATINESSIKELSNITWTEEQKLIHPEDIKFFNTVSSNTGLTLSGKKNLEGRENSKKQQDTFQAHGQHLDMRYSDDRPVCLCDDKALRLLSGI